MTDFCWLIEAPGARYLGARRLGRDEFFWTQSPQDALRFLDKHQADKVMMAVRELDRSLFAFAANLGDALPVEHGYLSAAPAGPAIGHLHRLDAPKPPLTKARDDTTGEVGAFTPGPWSLCLHLRDPDRDSICPCGYRGGIWGPDGEHMVCEMGSTQVKGEEALAPARYARPVELANARLIAAAPDLYRQLVFAVAILEEARARVDYAPGSLGEIEINEAIDDGYAAIAKALPLSAHLDDEGKELIASVAGVADSRCSATETDTQSHTGKEE